jgi:predicted Zn-dependent protease
MLSRWFRALVVLGGVVVGAALLVAGCSDSSGPTGMDPGDDPGSGGGGGGGSTVEFDSRAAPGDSARSFLTDRRFSVLALEIDYMEGYEPTQAAINDLTASLDAHLRKSSIDVRTSQIPAAGSGAYSTADVQDLEEQHRDHYTRAESDTLWAYFVVVDGEYSESNVLGIAYYNTSMAFFGETIQSISGGVTEPSREKVEATVFRHEFGHNLGLVANGIPPQQDHHDAANGAHCTNDQCVMYYSIETTDYFANLFDGSVPEFEQFCTEDMEAAGGS